MASFVTFLHFLREEKDHFLKRHHRWDFSKKLSPDFGKIKKLQKKRKNSKRFERKLEQIEAF
jgi:hypothetical protein